MIRGFGVTVVLPVLLALPAGAQESVALWIRPQAAPAAAASELGAQLEARLLQTPGIIPVRPAEPIDPAAVAEGRERAESELEAAFERYRKFDEAGALASLEASEAALVNACGRADGELLRSQRLLRGLLHFMAGRTDQAREGFAELAVLDEGFELDPGLYAPKIVAAFREARAGVTAQERGLLEVDAMPHGAQVRVDGRPIGPAPSLLERTLPGAHCVEVEAPEHAPWIRQVTLPPGQPVRLRAILFPLRAPELLAAPAGCDFGELARLFGADMLALVTLEADAAKLVAVRADTGRMAPPKTCPASWTGPLDPLAECLRRSLLEAREALAVPLGALAQGPKQPVVGGPDGDRPPGAELDRGPRWYQRWWFWAAIGAAVAGTGALVGLLAAPDDGRTGYRVIVTH